MVKATVAAIISKITEQGDTAILLTKRNQDPYKNQWCLPGGHIDPNEKAKTAIIREVKEETGLEFKGAFFKYFDEIIEDKGIHAVVLVFKGSAKGEFFLQEEEVKEANWFNKTEMLNLNFAFNHREIIDIFYKDKILNH